MKRKKWIPLNEFVEKKKWTPQIKLKKKKWIPLNQFVRKEKKNIYRVRKARPIKSFKTIKNILYKGDAK